MLKTVRLRSDALYLLNEPVIMPGDYDGSSAYLRYWYEDAQDSATQLAFPGAERATPGAELRLASRRCAYGGRGDGDSEGDEADGGYESDEHVGPRGSRQCHEERRQHHTEADLRPAARALDAGGQPSPKCRGDPGARGRCGEHPAEKLEQRRHPPAGLEEGEDTGRFPVGARARQLLW